MSVENISWSISTKECCRPRRGLNPRPSGLQSDGASNWATEAEFCKVKGQKGSSDGAESIYQGKVDDSLHSDVKVKERVCYVLKSRLLTAPGTVDGQKVVVLRDTGCTRVVVRRNLVSQDQLIGKDSTVTLIDETTQRHPLAVIYVDCPFLRVKLRLMLGWHFLWLSNWQHWWF